jgi:hypothetical protein
MSAITGNLVVLMVSLPGVREEGLRILAELPEREFKNIGLVSNSKLTRLWCEAKHLINDLY